MSKIKFLKKALHNMYKSWLVPALAVVICLGGASLHVSAEETQDTAAADTEGTILSNVYIGEVNVGGMSTMQARTACAAYIDGLNMGKVVFTCGEDSAEATLAGLGVAVDADRAVEAAYAVGHKGNVLERYRDNKSVASGEAYSVDLGFALGDSAYQGVEEAVSGFNQEASPATIAMVDGEFDVRPEQVGRVVDVQATLDALYAKMNEVGVSGEYTVEVSCEETQPEVTSDELDGITDKLGSFTTTYSGDAGRMANVENACSFINGTLVLPGEEFDTDAAIRPYTEENGYHYAAEYNNGQVVQGLGGGVCQVSTTLYNAVLYAELEVTQRANHSLTVGYVQLAQDAAISGDYKNFKFRNNTDTPIYIAGACEDGQLTFAIFGKETRPENRTLDFESVLVSTIPAGDSIVTVDDSLPAGAREVTQKAHTGYVAELWKHVYVDGELTDSIKVNTSQYNASPERVTVGPDADEEDSSDESSDENPDAVTADAPVADTPAETPVEAAPTGAPSPDETPSEEVLQ